MEIKRINNDDAEQAREYLNIPVPEIRKLFQKIVSTYNTHLKSYGVAPLWKETIDWENLTDGEFIENIDTKALQMVFLYKYMQCFVHKDTVSAFIRKYNSPVSVL